jgi:hypothetical protein
MAFLVAGDASCLYLALIEIDEGSYETHAFDCPCVLPFCGGRLRQGHGRFRRRGVSCKHGCAPDRHDGCRSTNFKAILNTPNQIYIRGFFIGDNGVIVKVRPGGDNTTLSTSPGRCADFHGFTTISVPPLNAKGENGIYCQLP